MKSILLSVISFLLVMNVCGKNDVDMRTYLKKVLGNLGKIESASYHEQSQSWQPGDTVAITNFHRFIKEYTNPSDSTIGASYVCLDAKDTTRFEFGYDGNVRMISYHEHKGIMIDDFTTRSLPFRLVAPPFFCYTRNIIGYALSTGDSITTEWKDLGEAYYFKLVIHEDRQVEFFGKRTTYRSLLLIWETRPRFTNCGLAKRTVCLIKCAGKCRIRFLLLLVRM